MGFVADDDTRALTALLDRGWFAAVAEHVHQSSFVGRRVLVTLSRAPQ